MICRDRQSNSLFAVFRSGLGLLLISLTLVGSLAAEEDPAQWAFSEFIDVRSIDLEVVVTDAEGRRVTGLKSEEFILQVDTRPVAIEYFEEWLNRGTVTARQADTQRPRQGRSFLVFIDDYFTARRYRAAVIKKLIAELDQIGPADQMVIVRYRGKQLDLVSDWSRSPEHLGAALAKVNRQASGELTRQNRLQHSGYGTQRVELLEQQIKKITGTVTAAMRSFSEVPGRKLLVLVSAGWPTDLPTGSGPGVRAAQLRRGGPSLLKPVVDTANLLGFTIYPLHVGFHQRSGGSSLSSMKYLATESGGEVAAYATVAKAPFARLVEDTRSYYVLGFSPTWRGNDANHWVDVAVPGSGYEVRHRRGFRDLSRRSQVSMSTEAALLLGAPAETLEVSLGAIRRTGLSKIEVPVELRVPMDWVTMLPSGDQYISVLELRVAAVDGKGDRSEMPVIPIRLAGAKPAKGSFSLYSTTLQLRRRKQRLVLSLHDQPTGESVMTTLELDPSE